MDGFFVIQLRMMRYMNDDDEQEMKGKNNNNLLDSKVGPYNFCLSSRLLHVVQIITLSLSKQFALNYLPV